MFTLSLRTAALLAILPFTASASARGEAHSSEATHGSGATTQQKVMADLVPIEGGTFLMGNFGPVHNEDKPPYSGAMNDDVLRKITLDGFSIMAHKISIEDFDAFTNATGRPEVGASKINADLYRADLNAAAGVKWQDAMNFCTWAEKGAGRKLMLPTEEAVGVRGTIEWQDGCICDRYRQYR
ncbi:TPA: SUMF1/EgtB/PvdO family nonheme iron enzyme [Stenotrophomonas maltophilia]